MTSDLGEHMKAVALALLGEPNRDHAAHPDRVDAMHPWRAPTLVSL
jgi:hypothetical protein